MKSRIARLGVLAAAVVGLMATMVPSASATTVKEITFTGTAQVPGGLGYPGAGTGGPDTTKIPCIDGDLTNISITTTNPPFVTVGASVDPNCVTVKTGPKGEPQVNLRPEGNHSSFSFGSTACAKVTVSTSVAKKTPGPQVCTISAAGAVWGYCGLSTGMGVATIDDTTPVTVAGTKQSQSIGIKFTGVGGVLYVTGGDQQTNVYGFVVAVPTVGTCTNKTATAFQLTGDVTYKDCNGSTPVC